MPHLYSSIVRGVEALKRRGKLATLATHTFYGRPLDEQSIVVDLGGNVGKFASAIVREKGVTCHTVEAVRSVFNQIPSDRRIHKYNLAISDRNGPLKIFGSKNHEANSIHSSIAASAGLREVETCDGVVLESFLSTQGIGRIDLLKIDIEGSEDLLFASTPDHVLRRIAQITIEFHDFVDGSISAEAVNGVVARLQSLGFYRLPFSYLYPQMANADVLFVQPQACRVSAHDLSCFRAIKALLQLERTKSRLVSRVRR